MSKTKIKLAEALLRRKELHAKVQQLFNIKNTAFYEVRAQRIKVSDNFDEVTAHVPKLTAAQITAEYDYYAKQLRFVDAAIQQCNWTADIEVPVDSLRDWAESKS